MKFHCYIDKTMKEELKKFTDVEEKKTCEDILKNGILNFCPQSPIPNCIYCKSLIIYLQKLPFKIKIIKYKLIIFIIHYKFLLNHIL